MTALLLWCIVSLVVLASSVSAQYAACTSPSYCSSCSGCGSINMNGVLACCSSGSNIVCSDFVNPSTCTCSSPQSCASSSPPSPPTAPTIGTASVSTSNTVSVGFTLPSGSITACTAVSFPGEFSGTGTSSPIIVSGLGANTAYTFTVSCSNSAGTSPPSSASNSVTTLSNPTAAPTAPTTSDYTVTTIGNSATSCTQCYGVLKDATSNAIYAACSDSGILAFVGTAVTTLASTSTCYLPSALFQNPTNHKLYAGCSYHSTTAAAILAISTTTNSNSVQSVANTPSPCGDANGLFVDSSSGTIYAACFSTGVIAIASSGTITSIASSQQCPMAQGVYKDTSTGNIYVACLGTSSTTGVVIRISSSNTVTTIATSTQCSFPMGITGFAGMVFVACNNGPAAVISINTNTLAINNVVSLTQCGDPQQVSADSSRQMVAVTCGSVSNNAVVSLQTSSGVVSILASSSQCPNSAAVYSDVATGVIYAGCRSNSGGGIVAIATTSTGSVSSTGSAHGSMVSSSTGPISSAALPPSNSDYCSCSCSTVTNPPPFVGYVANSMCASGCNQLCINTFSQCPDFTKGQSGSMSNFCQYQSTTTTSSGSITSTGSSITSTGGSSTTQSTTTTTQPSSAVSLQSCGLLLLLCGFASSLIVFVEMF